MKHTQYSQNTLLAVLQQAEYDRQLFGDWTEQFHVVPAEHLAALKPERWTAKLRIIRQIARIFAPVVGNKHAILAALSLFSPLEDTARQYLLWKARKKLRQLQEDGLTVIAIAGSFGKTSTKHLLTHTLSGRLNVLASPGSYNTPLGLAASINRLNSKHDVFIAELGEYKPGDIAELLELLRPEIGILTPTGHAHLERFGSQAKMDETFAELWTSEFAPELVLIDDHNRHLPAPENALWYGNQKTSDLPLSIKTSDLHGTQGTLHFSDDTTLPFFLSLPGESLAHNALPGLLMWQFFQQPMDAAITALSYVQPIERRLELHRNPNGTKVIDNSYNTNPAAWSISYDVLKELEGTKAILTAGFVELSPEAARDAHQKLAHDLVALKAWVGVVRTRENELLIEALTKQLTPNMLSIGTSYDELLAMLHARGERLETIWLEGGVRELYQ